MTFALAKHRPGGPWSDDDYDVVDDEGDVGRILFAAANYTGGPELPWFWSITCKFPSEPADRGNAASREEAMRAFKARWVEVARQLPLLRAALVAHASKHTVTKKIEPQADAA